MSLATITTSRANRPPRVLLYGPEGIGKTTFGAGAPAPIFLAPEDGTAQVDVQRFPEPKAWADVEAALAALELEHEYKTLVIDTLDWLEPLVHVETCRRHGWKEIEEPGFGKGYAAALNIWRAFFARLDGLRTKHGMQVILLAHAMIRPFNNPETDPYDRYELKLYRTAGGLAKEWSDAVLFANYETLTSKKNGRARAVSTGARFIYTERRAAYDAKNRYGLPEQMPLSWADFEAARLGAGAVAPATSEIEVLIQQVDATTQTQARAYLKAKPRTPRELTQLADRLRAKAAILNPPTNDKETK
jgi:hypothetical protein